MPLLSELRAITAPVTIRRGNLEFTLNVALEKFTPEEGEYGELRFAMVEIAQEKKRLRAENEELLRQVTLASDLPTIRFDLMGPNGLDEDMERIHADENLTPQEKQTALEAAQEAAWDRITPEMVNEEFGKRLQAAEAAVDANQKQIDAADVAEHKNVAMRLAYLVASSDIEITEGVPALSGKVEKTPEELQDDADFFYKNMSVALLIHCLRKVEDTVYGPLETASSSAN